MFDNPNIKTNQEWWLFWRVFGPVLVVGGGSVLLCGVGVAGTLSFTDLGALRTISAWRGTWVVLLAVVCLMATGYGMYRLAGKKLRPESWLVIPGGLFATSIATYLLGTVSTLPGATTSVTLPAIPNFSDWWPVFQNIAYLLAFVVAVFIFYGMMRAAEAFARSVRTVFTAVCADWGKPGAAFTKQHAPLFADAYFRRVSPLQLVVSNPEPETEQEEPERLRA